MQVFAEALESNSTGLHQRASGYLSVGLRRNFSATALIHYLRDTNSPLSLYAADALGSLAEINARLPENVLPALTNALNDLRPKVRTSAAAALVYFRNSPEIVGPALLDLWNDPDQSVRRAATNSFFQLPPFSRLNIAQLTIGMAQEQADMVAKRYQTLPYSSVLARLMSDPDIRIREMATNVFRKLREPNGSKDSTSEDPIR
jgi:HEAT repeat protein